MPDLDFAPGLLLGDFDQFHNTVSNSLLVGLLIAFLVGAIVWIKRRQRFIFWGGFALLCYEVHVIMDYFTIGRGVMLFWPFSTERFEPAVKLFYGLHRSAGWISIQHLWTLLTEIAFTLIVLLLLRAIEHVQLARR